MTLYNAAKRARTAGQLINRNSGGGNKKMGLFPSIGNESWTSMAYGRVPGKCFTLGCSQRSRYPNVCATGRPIGSTVLVGWRCKA